jgi:hypothetical protein
MSSIPLFLLISAHIGFLTSQYLFISINSHVQSFEVSPITIYYHFTAFGFRLYFGIPLSIWKVPHFFLYTQTTFSFFLLVLLFDPT